MQSYIASIDQDMTYSEFLIIKEAVSQLYLCARHYSQVQSSSHVLCQNSERTNLIPKVSRADPRRVCHHCNLGSFGSSLFNLWALSHALLFLVGENSLPAIFPLFRFSVAFGGVTITVFAKSCAAAYWLADRLGVPNTKAPFLLDMLRSPQSTPLRDNPISSLQITNTILFALAPQCSPVSKTHHSLRLTVKSQ